ncbi:MAG: GNAT family N-acetyltransferase [Candidatus Eremiobacteraeota bacterium]|nr:GNAT family N-acetyltransferase [Candidatus Eremiobacteraeota bacterium]
MANLDPMADFVTLGTEKWDRAAARAYQLERFLYRNQEAELRLLRPGRGQPWVSNPYGYVGGLDLARPELAQDLPEVLERLLRESRAPYALVRTLEPLPESILDSFTVDTRFHTFFLDLAGGADHVWKKKMASKVRRQTRRGLRHGVTARIGHLDLFDDFVSVLSRCWRDLGTPFHRPFYFRELLTNYGPSHSAVLNLYRGDEPVSTAMLLVNGHTVFHPYTGTLRDSQREGVNNVLYWRIIEWACARGCRWWDMGRSREDTSHATYKRPWGVEERPLFYNYFLAPGAAVQNLESPLVKLAVKAWKNLPVALHRLLGPPLIRRVL